MSRPQWAQDLWFWVTDTQYDKLTDRIDVTNHRRITTRVDAFHWWWRENLVENPVKRSLCLIYGHKIVACEQHTHCYCVYCNKTPKD